MHPNLDNIEVGDWLESEDGRKAYIKKILPEKLIVLINNKKEIILNTDFYLWKYANPIKDNRIVSDYTFAVRFKHFIEHLPKNYKWSDPMIYEECEYMEYIAKRLLKYQKQTVSDEWEIKYLKQF